MNKEEILNGEIFFEDPNVEYEYFRNRMDQIKKYNSEFIQQQAISSLISRYIKAIVSLTDDLECAALKDVYLDCLNQLGIDSYIIDQEVDNYQKTHVVDKQNIHVSKTGRL